MFCTSLRRTRLEVMGALGKNAPPLACPSRVPRSFLRRYFQAPATQACISDRALNMEREQQKKEDRRGRGGEGERGFLFSPPLPPLFLFFALIPNFVTNSHGKGVGGGGGGGGGGGHWIIWPWRVCAAEQGMVFRVLSLKQGIWFQNLASWKGCLLG